MGYVVSELTNLRVLRANIRIERRTHGSNLGIVPVAVTIRTSCMIISKLVIGVGDPEGSWGLVGVNQRERSLVWMIKLPSIRHLVSAASSMKTVCPIVS